MKMNKLFFIATIIVVSLSTCKKPTEGLQLIVGSNPVSAKLEISINNANPNSSEAFPVGLTVEIKGTDADKVYDISGINASKVQPANGILSLMVLPADKPTENNPLTFFIIAKAPGYMTANCPISIGDTGLFAFDIAMLKLDEAPAGVSATVNTSYALSSGGEVTEDISIDLQASAGKQESAKILIPKGTILKDASGNPVSGNITISMAHHDNRAFESLNSFPGGLFTDDVVDADGKPMDNLTFETLGLLNLEITNGTQTVKTFSQPILATVELNETSIHPNKGVAIQEGDTVPIWSRDEITGQWTFEGYEPIVKDPTSGKLSTTMHISHLSPWNIDWFFWSWWWWSPWSFCSAPSVNVNSNEEGWVYYELYSTTNAFISSGARYVYRGNNRLTFNSQTGRSATLRIYQGSSWWDRTKLLATSSVFSLCSGNTSVNITLPQLVTVDVTIRGECPNARILKPSLTIYYKKSGSNWFERLGTMYSGRLVTRLLETGKTYTFGAYYRGRWYEYTHLIDKTTYNEVMQLQSKDAACQ
jgi:hypothetical protein